MGLVLPSLESDVGDTRSWGAARSESAWPWFPPKAPFPRGELGALEREGKGAGRWRQLCPSLAVPLALLADPLSPVPLGLGLCQPVSPRLLARETLRPRLQPALRGRPVSSVPSTSALLGERVLLRQRPLHRRPVEVRRGPRLRRWLR